MVALCDLCETLQDILTLLGSHRLGASGRQAALQSASGLRRWIQAATRNRPGSPYAGQWADHEVVAQPRQGGVTPQ